MDARTNNGKAVVLLSGGLDSMVCAALAREAGFEVLALTVDYGQKHRIELAAAQTMAAALAERHIILPLDDGVRRIRADQRPRGSHVRSGRRHPGHLRAGAQYNFSWTRP